MLAAFADWVAGLCVFAIAYHYALYPACVLALSKLRRPREMPLKDDPTVTLIIAAYNERHVIRQKLENALALEYAAGKLQVIVVSDGSTDDTPSIVNEYAGRGVVGLFDPVRRGKSHALNRAVETATGKVLVFSDANNVYSRDAIKVLVRALADPRFGGVSGAKKIVENAERASSVGDGMYWRYESAIKKAESEIYGTVAADGEIFAMWHELFRLIPPDVINDDAFLTLLVVQAGYRVGYEPRATASEEASIFIGDDFRVKVRMVAGGYQFVVMFWRDLLKSARFAFMFFSHKILRWTMPIFLIVLFVVSILRLSEPLYRPLFAAQLMFYVAAMVGSQSPRLRSASKGIYVPFYFTVMNLAALMGLVKYLGREQTVLWTKATRK